MRLLHSVGIASQSTTFFLPMGQWGAFVIEYDVTTDTGKTGTLASCGNINLKWNGQDIINVDAEILNLLNNVYGGVAEATLATAGANRISVIIPCGLWYDSKNVYDISNSDQVSFKLDFSALTALCAGVGSVRIYGVNKIGVHNYFHKLVSRFVNVGAATTASDNFPVKNISQIYLKDPATSNVTTIRINKDGDNIIDCAVPVLKAYSANIHLLETTSTTIAIEFGHSKDIRENVGSEVSYQYVFSGAGTLSQYFSFIEFTSSKREESMKRAELKLAVKVNNALK